MGGGGCQRSIKVVAAFQETTEEVLGSFVEEVRFKPSVERGQTEKPGVGGLPR